MGAMKSVRCPVCGNKTRLQITVIKEPDAKTQSRRTCEQSQFVGSLFSVFLHISF